MDVKDNETYSEEETRKRAAATLKVMLTTPHKPHKPKDARRKAGTKNERA